MKRRVVNPGSPARAAFARDGVVKPPRRMPHPVSGVCRFCRCTDELACEAGCAWVDSAHTVCSNFDCLIRYIKFLEHALRIAVAHAKPRPQRKHRKAAA